MPKSLFLPLLVLCSVAAASDYWQGSVKTPSGTIPIGIAIDGKEATLYAPALGVVDKPLSIVYVAEHRLFELHFDERAVTADLLEYGDSLAGEAKVGSERYAVSLHRARKPQEAYHTEDVVIRSGESNLRGTLYLPKSATP